MTEDDQEAISIIGAMVETLGCPVSIAEDHVTRLRLIAHDVERFRDVALFARKLYETDRGPFMAQLSPLLADFGAMMGRFASEMGTFAARFEALNDHEIEHRHLEPEEIPLEELVTAMFGPPPADDGPRDDIPF